VKTTLVSIPTETVPLDGAWHEPEGAASGAALLFHGNTMNFYQGAPRFLPPALARMGLASLAFNRRGRDILGIRTAAPQRAPRFRPTPRRSTTTASRPRGSRRAAFPIRW
jgi:hypothetical protein